MPSDSMLLDGYPTARPVPPRPSSGRQQPVRPPTDSASLCRVVLADMLQQTVISRLRLAHPEAGVAPSNGGAGATPADCASRLAALLRRGSQHEVDVLVDLLLTHIDIDTLFLDMAPAVDDAVQERSDSEDHAEATLAGWRLLEMIERFSPRFQAAATTVRHGRRVLLAEAETAGRRVALQLTQECLTRDGWDVWAEPRSTPADLAAMVAREWFAMVALDTANLPVEQISTLVRRLRRAACNTQLRVLVISPALGRRPDSMARLGADAAATSLRHACAQARRLLTLMPDRL